jgi:hypothetical protein
MVHVSAVPIRRCVEGIAARSHRPGRLLEHAELSHQLFDHFRLALHVFSHLQPLVALAGVSHHAAEAGEVGDAHVKVAQSSVVVSEHRVFPRHF